MRVIVTLKIIAAIAIYTLTVIGVVIAHKIAELHVAKWRHRKVK